MGRNASLGPSNLVLFSLFFVYALIEPGGGLNVVATAEAASTSTARGGGGLGRQQRQ